jgi:hypothetical protein
MIRLLPAALLVLAMTLAARSQPALQVDPTPIAFTCALAGEDTALTIDVWNVGSTDVTILEYVATGPFVPPATRDFLLIAGEYVRERVRFQPLAAGTQLGTLTIRTSEGDFEVPMTGEVGAEPSIMPSMTAIDFFDVTVGGSKEVCFKVRNPSCRALMVNAATIDNAVFTMTGGFTTPFLLGPYADEDFCVTFTPTATGDASGRLAFEGDLGKRAVVRLNGRGVLSEISAEPSLVNFGAVDLGMTSPEIIVEVVNRGTQSATIDQPLTIVGANPGDFAVTSAAVPINVAPGDRVPLRVRFSPTAMGSRSAQLVINNTSSVDPVVELRGVGATFAVTVTPDSIDMGDVFVGSTKRADDTVAVMNQSTRTVTIASTRIEGADPSVFAVLGFVTVPIAANEDYKLDISFAPTAPRVFTAELVGTFDNGNTFRVPLRGRGLDTSAPRPRRISGDTVAARVGERRMLRFEVNPPITEADAVTRLYVRLRVDPKAVYVHRVQASAGLGATHTYAPNGAVEIVLSSPTALVLDHFDLEVEGLFTGRPFNTVIVDSVAFDNARIGVTSTAGGLALDGCDINGSDTLLRVVRIATIAPNPANDVGVVTYRASSSATLRVISLDGRLVYTTEVPATGESDASIELPLDAHADGAFILELVADGVSDRRILQINR